MQGPSALTEQEPNFDVAILGDDPVGAYLAALLARRGARVALVSLGDDPARACPLHWLSTRAFDDLKLLQGLRQQLVTGAFHEVRFLSADLQRQATAHLDPLAGYWIRPPDFAQALLDFATQAGAQLFPAAPNLSIQSAEDAVGITLESQQLFARFAVVAGPALSPAAIQLTQNEPDWTHHLAPWWWVELPPHRGREITIAYDLENPARLTLLCQSHTAGAAIHYAPALPAADAPQAEVDRLLSLCARAEQAGLLVGRPIGEPTLAGRLAPGAARGWDGHVAKRSLIIGEAGGFVSEISVETAYPGLYSAQVAADILDKAIRSQNPQDVLARFKTAWREQLADHLRPPNTNLAFLLPLVFTNEQITARFAEAWMRGSNL